MNKQRIEALKAKENYKIGDLIEIMSILREPGGCRGTASRTTTRSAATSSRRPTRLSRR